MPSVAPPPTSVAAITLSVYRAPSCTKVFGVSDHNLPNLPIILGPNITGKFGIIWSAALSILVQEGALYAYTFRPGQLSGGTINYGIPYLGFDANKSSSVYGNASTVQPSSLIFNYIIKY